MVDMVRGADVFDPRGPMQDPVMGGEPAHVRRLFGFGDDWSGMTLLPPDQWTIEPVKGRADTALISCWQNAGFRAYRLIRVDPPQDQNPDADVN